MTPELIEALEKTPHGAETYILSELNRPYTKESFGNTSNLGRQSGAAGMLLARPAETAAVLYAESGATAPRLMALFGWSNMKTAQIYIAQADKRRMAANAQERLAAHRKSQNVSKSATKKRDETIGAKSEV